MQTSVFEDLFEHVVVINLDRRKDRMSAVADQLTRLGVQFERFSAFDGQTPQVAAEWQAYSDKQRSLSNDPRQVENWRDFYLGDKPHEARVQFFEKNRGQPAIATTGAWGVYRSMRSVIQNAVASNVESLLILEDDVLFHRDTVEIWQKVTAELPKNWQILQLGAMQLHWEDDWIEWHSQHLYKCLGSSLACHAVALRSDAMRAILARSHDPDLPFDIGPMTEVKRIYQNRCFTVYPNLAIQDAKDSEIGMSQIFASEAKKTNNVYRWDWSLYGPSTLRANGSTTKKATGVRAPRNDAPPEIVSGLQPYSAPEGAAERFIFIFSSENEIMTDRYALLLKEQKDKGKIAPIALIDDLKLVPLLRQNGIVFEYVPSAKRYAAGLPSNRDPELVIARRLHLLRIKWRPRRIIALGSAAEARLAYWRKSPFEQSSMGPDLLTEPDQSDSSE